MNISRVYCGCRMAQGQSNWASLSTELWDTIFSCLQPILDCECMYTTRASLQHTPRLSAVCTRLRNVIAQPQKYLHSMLFLAGDAGSEGGPAVISSVQQSHMYLHTLVADCSPIVEQGLLILLTCQCPLDTAYIAHTQSANMLRNSVSLLGNFSSLTACILHMHRDEDRYDLDWHQHPDPISLAPLRGLPHLALLDLSRGHFTDLEAAMHLTALKLIHCDAACAVYGMMVSSLVQLHISDGDLVNLHGDGVTACSALLSLVCEEVVISADDGKEYLNIVDAGHLDSQFPASMSKLTALTNLRFSAAWGAEGLHISWLNSLHNLRSISILMHAKKVDVCCSLSCLRNLTNLEVSNSSYGSRGLLHFEPCLADLVALETLCLDGQLSFGPATLNIVTLPRLAKVTLSGFDKLKCPMTTWLQVVMLASQLAAHRPDVSLMVEHQQVQ